jgi:methanogenic corrinoid protein MtbC1
VDLPVEEFIQKMREVEPDVVGMSALLTASIPQVKDTIEAMEMGALQERAEVIVGGGIVVEVSLSEVKADHATTDANEGIKVIARWRGP